MIQPLPLPRLMPAATPFRRFAPATLRHFRFLSLIFDAVFAIDADAIIRQIFRHYCLR
jgi:hypothetical protein